ncbi:MAG: hypothetical protein AB7U83_05860 [Vicinamibacterales bacterium]
MRLSPTRLASDLLIGIIVSMALAQAGAAMEIDGLGRDLHARVTRVGTHRLDADGSHPAADVEDATHGVVAPLAVHLYSGPAAPPGGAAAGLAPPGAFDLLPVLAPPAPRSRLDAASHRGRAPPSA